LPENKNDLLNPLGLLLFQASRSTINRLNRNFASAGYEITIEQWKILKMLWDKDGLSQKELAEGTWKDKASLARTLDIMEKQNYVVRINDQTDKRQKLIYLTTKAKFSQKELKTIADKTTKEAESNFSSDQITQLNNMLQQIIKNLKG